MAVCNNIVRPHVFENYEDNACKKLTYHTKYRGFLLASPFCKLNKEYTADTLQKRLTFRVNLPGAGLGAELKLSGKTSLYLEGGIGLMYRYYIYSGPQVISAPYLRLQGRYFHTIENRTKQGRNTRKFADDYIAPSFIAAYNTWEEQYEYMIALAGGIQRNIWKFFYWGIEVGIGMNFFPSNLTPGMFIHPKLGVAI
ncbi:MAG: hypothetical protein COA57_01165 [Flavobacteriales bacterium]|nr:MAG: hypothetical protein COA57_01165 [Flavobacteriales bacterium]